MTPEDYLINAAERMAADGSTVTTVDTPMGQALVGYHGEFRVRWAATRLHLFVVIASVPVAAKTELLALIAQTTQIALGSKGKTRGNQVGIVAVPVLIAPEVTDDAVASVRRRPPIARGFFFRPQVIDLGTGQVHRHRGGLVHGFLYRRWISDRIAAVPAPSVATGAEALRS